jgi:hypothetical protein
MEAGKAYETTLIVSDDGVLVDYASATVSVYRNAVLTSITPATSKVSKGTYRLSFDVPSNWVLGDVVDIHVEGIANAFVFSIKSSTTVQNLGAIKTLIQNAPSQTETKSAVDKSDPDVSVTATDDGEEVKVTVEDC